MITISSIIIIVIINISSSIIIIIVSCIMMISLEGATPCLWTVVREQFVSACV